MRRQSHDTFMKRGKNEHQRTIIIKMLTHTHTCSGMGAFILSKKPIKYEKNILRELHNEEDLANRHLWVQYSNKIMISLVRNSMFLSNHPAGYF